jgi:hypothetical protein
VKKEYFNCGFFGGIINSEDIISFLIGSDINLISIFLLLSSL